MKNLGARRENYYDASVASHSFTVFFYSAGNVPYWFAVQVSDTTMLNNDYMLTTK